MPKAGVYKTFRLCWLYYLYFDELWPGVRWRCFYFLICFCSASTHWAYRVQTKSFINAWPHIFLATASSRAPPGPRHSGAKHTGPPTSWQSWVGFRWKHPGSVVRTRRASWYPSNEDSKDAVRIDCSRRFARTVQIFSWKSFDTARAGPEPRKGTSGWTVPPQFLCP